MTLGSTSDVALTSSAGSVLASVQPSKGMEYMRFATPSKHCHVASS